MTFQQWKDSHDLPRGTPIYAALKPSGMTQEQEKLWTKGLRPVVGMNCWATVDDGWREQAQARIEFLCLEEERQQMERGHQ